MFALAILNAELTTAHGSLHSASRDAQNFSRLALGLEFHRSIIADHRHMRQICRRWCVVCRAAPSQRVSGNFMITGFVSFSPGLFATCCRLITTPLLAEDELLWEKQAKTRADGGNQAKICRMASLAPSRPRRRRWTGPPPRSNANSKVRNWQHWRSKVTNSKSSASTASLAAKANSNPSSSSRRSIAF
jgi:hypothetical protein